MRRGEAWKPLRDRGGWMQMSERVVFYALLERSNNTDCSIPAYMTPSLDQLAEASCCSKSAAAAAVRHLELHGWIERKRTLGGRGHKTGYQLLDGASCAPGCGYWRPQKQSNERTVSVPKQSNERTEKLSNEVVQPRRSTRVLHGGITEGEEKEEPSPNRKLPPDWSLIRQLVRIVHADPCGGLHRDALAEQLHLPARGQTFGDALAIAYHNKKIGFCGQYVVKPVPVKGTP